ncbi:hypothetical protein [Lacrimispora brassicae]
MKYTIEMSYSVGITVNDIVADSEVEAVEIAKRRVDQGVIFVEANDIDCGPLKFKDVTFCEFGNE